MTYIPGENCFISREIGAGIIRFSYCPGVNQDLLWISQEGDGWSKSICVRPEEAQELAEALLDFNKRIIQPSLSFDIHT